ncbi:MAG: leucine-rich repeat domain-containing protein [Chitinispirillales bacterium]|jgi:hypothetical protein|nr:leucine-rich repeat domain-containing protein [Chitinispirillales bacterium]
MGRKALAGLALFAAIGIGASSVFAQGDATLGKLSITSGTVRAADKSIRGEVVIPAKAANSSGGTATWSVSAIARSGFDGCTNITGVSMSENMRTVNEYAFANCTRLTSVTFGATGIKIVNANAFPGDLMAKYMEGGSGTYVRDNGDNVWFKEGGGRRGGGGPGPGPGGPPPRGGIKYCTCCGQPLPQ